jgi:hypothetical protein
VHSRLFISIFSDGKQFPCSIFALAKYLKVEEYLESDEVFKCLGSKIDLIESYFCFI